MAPDQVTFALQPTVGDIARCSCGEHKEIVAITELTDAGARLRRIQWECEGACGMVWSSWARIEE